MVCKNVNLVIVSSNCASVSVFSNIDLSFFCTVYFLDPSSPIQFIFFTMSLLFSVEVLLINVLINIVYDLFIDFY